MTDNLLLEVQGLRTTFRTTRGTVPAADGVSFSMKPGETLGVVGESGCGKSVTALSIMRLIADPPGRIESGRILFENEDLLAKTDAEMRAVRGNDIAMIFQEPMTSLNPVFSIGSQIAEATQLHRGVNRNEALELAVKMLRYVGLSEPERRIRQYPHQLSGGMRQRVMIAMALSCHPKLLIADEPTTALDVTIQAQICELLKRLKRELGMAIMLITHDLGVIAEMAQRVIVMYAGKVVEESETGPLFRRPLHPYTRGLLDSIPHLNRRTRRLHAIEGVVPSPGQMPVGCRFHPRCPVATERCRTEQPELSEILPGRRVSCFHPVAAGEGGAA